MDASVWGTVLCVCVSLMFLVVLQCFTHRHKHKHKHTNTHIKRELAVKSESESETEAEGAQIHGIPACKSSQRMFKAQIAILISNTILSPTRMTHVHFSLKDDAFTGRKWGNFQKLQHIKFTAGDYCSSIERIYLQHT